MVKYSDAFVMKRIRLGLSHMLGRQDVETWILLKHGNKTWSVLVDDREMANGWEEFSDAHNLQAYYIFEVLVL